MCNMMWVGISDPDIFRNVFATDGRWNRGKYSNSMVDEWVAKAQQSQSEAGRKTILLARAKKGGRRCSVYFALV